MTPASSLEWPDETVAVLRQLWAEGHSTAEIGRRLQRSKNAVVGKAHRLDLPGRESPIRRKGGDQTPRPPRHRPVPKLADMMPVASTPPTPPARPLAPRATTDRQTPATPATNRRTHSCCWPLGEPGRPGFRFCDAPAVPGRPYCDAHARLAYAKPDRTAEQIAGCAST
jgi:GcrA cell cycle regulator